MGIVVNVPFEKLKELSKEDRMKWAKMRNLALRVLQKMMKEGK